MDSKVLCVIFQFNIFKHNYKINFSFLKQEITETFLFYGKTLHILKVYSTQIYFPVL